MLEEIDHTADAGFKVTADSFEDMILQIAMGMLDLMYDLNDVEKKQTRTLELKAPAADLLLHDFLSELVQITQYDQFLIKEIHFDELDLKHLVATVYGEPLDKRRHKLHSEIKGVTYHMLCAEPRGDKWFGRVIFDL
ncbi:hypothetical protein DRQ33_03340 [bacterium]|nr:MAG: hypothetical protein DRQ33_03340 [bacterium]